MVISLLLAVAARAHFAAMTPVSGYQVWEEIPGAQKFPGYHPMLRFNAETTFVFATKDFIAEGKYSKQGDHYEFHPLMANEIENSDVDKLASDMNPDFGRKFRIAYFHSMADFSADFNGNTGALLLHLTTDGITKSYDLHAYTEGDDQLASLVTDDARPFVGLWHYPEPFPEKLDARTRYKIGGLEGLQQFFKEAAASDGAQFGLLDLRVDGFFRLNGLVEHWRREGSNIILRIEGKDVSFAISPKDGHLLYAGKAMYVRD